MNNQKIDFSISKIELCLKDILTLREDLKERIITSEELGEYISWLADNYGGNNIFSLDDLRMVPCSEKLNKVAKELLQHHDSITAKNELLEIYGPQSEKNFFAPGIDISVSRQIRYMPSHWHTNDYYEFYYNMGNTDIRISFPEEEVTLRKGTILLVSPSAVHACPILKEEDNLLFYMLRNSTFEDVFWHQLPEDSLMAKFFSQVINGGSSTSYLQFETDGDSDIESILTDIYFEYQEEENYKGKMLNAMMTTFFILLLRKYEDTVKLPRTKSFYWSSRFSALLSYIQTNYTTTNLNELSEKFSYSEKQISRIVSKYIGISYNQLILQLKMKRAAYLLSGAELSIDRIAVLIGYSTTSSFYRTFTSYYHMTPLEYRQNHSSEK